MKNTPDIYTHFQNCLNSGDLSALEAFEEKEFWQTLSEEERARLALLFLLRMENTLHGCSLEHFSDLEEMLWYTLVLVENMAPGNNDLLLRTATLFFYICMMTQEERFFLSALDKVVAAQVTQPDVFEKSFYWWYLWGRTLVAYGRFKSNDSLVQEGLHKYERAEALVEGTNMKKELYWDWADAWTLLGMHSQEAADLKKGVEKYQLAASSGADLPHFFIDYSQALVLLGEHLGNPHFVEKAIVQLKKALSGLTRESAPAAFAKAWKEMLLAHKMLVELTASDQAFAVADALFQEAIVTLPDQIDFWLDWGHLLFEFGLVTKQPQHLEGALEKVTHSKISESDPIETAILMGEALTGLGVYLEDLKFLKQAEKCVNDALEVAPEHPRLLLASGLNALGLATYFADEEYFNFAVEDLRLGLSHDPSSFFLWFALFQALIRWEEHSGNPELMEQALEAIGRAAELRPFSPYVWNEWGAALMNAKIDEREAQLVCLEKALEYLQRAIDLTGGFEGDPLIEWVYNYSCALGMLGDLTGEEECYTKSIDLLTRLYDVEPEFPFARYHLALALSRHGELTGNTESLYHAITLFESILSKTEEDEIVWGNLGYSLLNLAELTDDPLHPEKTNEFRHRAEKQLLKAAELGNTEAFYHLACLYSLSGLYEPAMEFLKRSEKANALPEIEDMEQDEWLDGVRQTEAFREFAASRRKE